MAHHLVGQLIGASLLLGAAMPSLARAGDGHIILYSERDRKGDALDIEDDTDNLGYTRWNDRARSLAVTGGTWEVCRHAGYRDCVTVSGWEKINDLASIDLDQAISSLRQTDRPQPSRLNSPFGMTVVWNDEKPRSVWPQGDSAYCRPDIREAFERRFGYSSAGEIEGDEASGRVTWQGKTWGYHCAPRQLDIWPE
ncbi:beta/gamma crystallin-related protein [Azospirillum sp. B4]|uniref:beta/gamma crystallin-related protein n=1 Tax=Azospirillum sp. B4 TaxID=95605 RepID=UPI00034B4B95|nr:beta/gamma crystallin-related protein [Azospirillum sp. B4]